MFWTGYDGNGRRLNRMHPLPQLSPPICWAAGLGNGSQNSSREHIVTEAVFPYPELIIGA